MTGQAVCAGAYGHGGAPHGGTGALIMPSDEPEARAAVDMPGAVDRSTSGANSRVFHGDTEELNDDGEMGGPRSGARGGRSGPGILAADELGWTPETVTEPAEKWHLSCADVPTRSEAVHIGQCRQLVGRSRILSLPPYPCNHNSSPGQTNAARLGVPVLHHMPDPLPSDLQLALLEPAPTSKRIRVYPDLRNHKNCWPWQQVGSSGCRSAHPAGGGSARARQRRGQSPHPTGHPPCSTVAPARALPRPLHVIDTLT